MTRYTHPDLTGTFGPRDGFTLDGVQYTRAFWKTADAAKIEAMGFVEYVPPEPEPPTLAELKTAKRTALATKRWNVETGGITVSGIAVPTDRETQDRVDQVVKAFDDGDITGTVNFKLAAATWATLDEATLRAIKAAGAQHIQACFSRECTLDGEIEAASDEAALDAIDIDAGWPA